MTIPFWPDILLIIAIPIATALVVGWILDWCEKRRQRGEH